MLDDLGELLRQVRLGAGSRPVFIMQPRACKALSREAYENGVTTVDALGGSVMGIPIMCSDGQADSTVTLADARGVAYWDTPVEVKTSRQATVELDTAPAQEMTTPTLATQTSLWQTNSVGILAEKSFYAGVIRPASVATMTKCELGREHR